MTAVTLVDFNGTRRDIALGDLPSASWFLVAGNCHSFAAALHDKTGLPIVAFYTSSSDEDEHIAHFAVITPEGLVIDGDGVMPVALIEARTGWEHQVLDGGISEMIELISYEQDFQGRHWQRLRPELVESFVYGALAKLP